MSERQRTWSALRLAWYGGLSSNDMQRVRYTVLTSSPDEGVGVAESEEVPLRLPLLALSYRTRSALASLVESAVDVVAGP